MVHNMGTPVYTAVSLMKVAFSVLVLVLVLLFWINTCCSASFSSKIYLDKCNCSPSPQFKSINLNGDELTPDWSGFQLSCDPPQISRKKSNDFMDTLCSNAQVTSMRNQEAEKRRFSTFLGECGHGKITDEALLLSMGYYYFAQERSGSPLTSQNMDMASISLAMIFSLFKDDYETYLRILDVLKSNMASNPSHIKSLFMKHISMGLFHDKLSFDPFSKVINHCFNFMCTLNYSMSKSYLEDDVINFFLSISFSRSSKDGSSLNRKKHQFAFERLCSKKFKTLQPIKCKVIENSIVTLNGLFILHTFDNKDVEKRNIFLTRAIDSSFVHLSPGDIGLILVHAVSNLDFLTFTRLLSNRAVFDYSLFLSAVNFTDDSREFVSYLSNYLPNISDLNLDPRKFIPLPWNAVHLAAIFRGKATDEEILAELLTKSCLSGLDVLLLAMDLQSINYDILADRLRYSRYEINIESFIRRSLTSMRTVFFIRYLLNRLKVDASQIYHAIINVMLETPAKNLTDIYFQSIISFATELVDLFNFALMMDFRDAITIMATRIEIEKNWSLVKADKTSHRSVEFVDKEGLQFLRIINGDTDFLDILI
jgi:hypothetical protein